MRSSCRCSAASRAHAPAREQPERPPDGPPIVWLAPEVEVRRHVEVGQQREVLVEGLDAERARVVRLAEATRLAVDDDLAGVGMHGAREHLDQRRLAGAVVADDGHDLARADREVDAVDGHDRAVALGQPAGLESAACRS